MCRRKSSAMQSIEVLCASQNLEAGTLTAKAKLLLGSYRRVCWATLGSCTLDTDDRYCVRHEGPEIALEYLRTYSPTEDKALFEAKLKTLFDSRWVMELVDDAMMQVKEFPDMGEQYFEILSKCYLSSMKYPETDLLDVLQMERSCYYDRKKEAVLAFGLAMWGTIIPRMKAVLQETSDCPD